MSMVINTNIGALQATLAQNRTNNVMEEAMTRLSTGSKLNSAADDAAGMAIAGRMESQVKGITMAIKNASDAQALIDTSEGAHEEITNILQRMRELAIQSANDTNTTTERTSLNSEITQLISEIDRIASETSWNGITVLDGNFTAKQFHIGSEAGQTVSVSVDSAASSLIGSYNLDSDAHVVAANAIDGEDLVIEGYLGAATATIGPADSVKAAVTAINAKTSDTGVSATGITKAKLSAYTAAEAIAFTLTGNAAASISVAAPSSTSDLSSLRDAINAKSGVTGINATFGDDKSEILMTHSSGADIKITGLDTTTNTTTITLESLDKNGLDLSTPDNLVMRESDAATGTVVGQMSLSSIKQFSVSGDDAVGEAGFFHTINGTAAGGTASLTAISSLDISTSTGANTAISAIDGALDKINAARGDLGAISNRLTYTLNNLGTIKVNTEASLSKIQDADFAVETSKLTKAQILSQAATAMLAQANASKQSVLSLLQG